MFGIGFIEICVIAVVAIVFVGPKKLPELMRHLGKFFVQARKMSNEVRQTFDGVVQQAEHELHLDEMKKMKEATTKSLTSSFIDADHHPGEHPGQDLHHEGPAPEGVHSAPDTNAHESTPDFSYQEEADTAEEVPSESSSTKPGSSKSGSSKAGSAEPNAATEEKSDKNPTDP